MRKRINVLLCFLCLTQCSPGREDLVGTWRNDSADLSLLLNDDETFQVSFTLAKGNSGAIFQGLKDLNSVADSVKGGGDQIRLKVTLLNLAFPEECSEGSVWYNSAFPEESSKGSVWYMSQISGKWRIRGNQLFLSPFEGQVKDRSGEVVAENKNRMPRSLIADVVLERDLLTTTLAEGPWKGSEIELIRQ